jgi:hypothetical protein
MNSILYTGQIHHALDGAFFLSLTKHLLIMVRVETNYTDIFVTKIIGNGLRKTAYKQCVGLCSKSRSMYSCFYGRLTIRRVTSRISVNIFTTILRVLWSPKPIYCYGVVSHKPSNALRPFLIYCAFPSCNHSWFIHQRSLAMIIREIW